MQGMNSSFMRPRRPLSRLSSSLFGVCRGTPPRVRGASLPEHFSLCRLGLVRHELRTPLAGIMGMAELLSDSPLRSEQAAWLGALQQSGRQLQCLLERVSRSGLAPVMPAGLRQHSFDGHRFLEQVMLSHWPEAKRKHLGLYLEVDQALPTQWHSHAPTLRQLLDNLIANSLKFTQAGHVLLRARLQRHASAAGPALSLCVEDTGVGFCEQADQSVYAVREQGQCTPQMAISGRGMGLQICRYNTQLLKGQLSNQSVPGDGSRFELVLPEVLRQQASGIRQRPALLGTLVCLLGLSGPLRAVVEHLLGRLGIGIVRMPSQHMDRLPEGVQVVICDPVHARRLRWLPGLHQWCAQAMLLSPDYQVSDSGAPGPPRLACTALPQPVIRSNLEPLLLQVALQRALQAGKGLE